TRAGGRTIARLDYRGLPVKHAYFGIVLRFELQEYLVAAAARMGIPIGFGSRCTGVTPAASGAVLRLASGDEHECEVVVGADGVHSAVRTAFGFPAVLRPLGWAALRGTVDLACATPVAREIWGFDGRIFGIVPLRDERTYFYCSAPHE